MFFCLIFKLCYSQNITFEIVSHSYIPSKHERKISYKITNNTFEDYWIRTDGLGYYSSVFDDSAKQPRRITYMDLRRDTTEYVFVPAQKLAVIKVETPIFDIFEYQSNMSYFFISEYECSKYLTKKDKKTKTLIGRYRIKPYKFKGSSI